MITPILRLLAIYCVVGLAVFGFFKRAAILEMLAANDAPVAVLDAPRVSTITAIPAPQPTPETAVFAPLPEAGGVEASAKPAEAALSEVKADYAANLNKARAAYWENDRATAIAIYGTLLADYPLDEAANGELGNIYFMNGQRDLAATHFEKAGMAAIKDGHRATVQMLIGVLRSINPAAATRLLNAGAGQ